MQMETNTNTKTALWAAFSVPTANSHAPLLARSLVRRPHQLARWSEQKLAALILAINENTRRLWATIERARTKLVAFSLVTFTRGSQARARVNFSLLPLTLYLSLALCLSRLKVANTSINLNFVSNLNSPPTCVDGQAHAQRKSLLLLLLLELSLEWAELVTIAHPQRARKLHKSLHYRQATAAAAQTAEWARKLLIEQRAWGQEAAAAAAAPTVRSDWRAKFESLMRVRERERSEKVWEKQGKFERESESMRFR